MTGHDFIAPFGILLQAYGLYKDRQEANTPGLMAYELLNNGKPRRLLWRVRASILAATVTAAFIGFDYTLRPSKWMNSLQETLFLVFLLMGLILLQFRRERDAYRLAVIRDVMES